MHRLIRHLLQFYQVDTVPGRGLSGGISQRFDGMVLSARGSRGPCIVSYRKEDAAVLLVSHGGFVRLSG
jgi:hypothetical protein